jgi:hypothetical protein
MKYILAILPLPALAFTLFANVTLQFANNRVPVYVVDEGNNACANGNFDEDDLVIYTQEAIRMWNSVPTSNLELFYAGVSPGSGTDFTTGELCNWDDPYPPAACANPTKVPQVSGIYIACSLNANDNQNFPQTGTFNASILGSTTMNNISGRDVVGSVVLLNTATGAVAIQNKTQQEIVAIIAHELGHAIGLGHSEKDYALMFSQLEGVRVNLSQDDINGVTYLYPMVFDGCGLLGTIADKRNHPPNPTGFSFALMLLSFILSGQFFAWINRRLRSRRQVLLK